MKFYFKFSDGSIAYLEDRGDWYIKPVKKYTSQWLGFGTWEDYK